jgi:hypothetical protein
MYYDELLLAVDDGCSRRPIPLCLAPSRPPRPHSKLRRTRLRLDSPTNKPDVHFKLMYVPSSQATLFHWLRIVIAKKKNDISWQSEQCRSVNRFTT